MLYPRVYSSHHTNTDKGVQHWCCAGNLRRETQALFLGRLLPKEAWEDTPAGQAGHVGNNLSELSQRRQPLGKTRKIRVEERERWQEDSM